jgi:hypothetical protein
MDSGAAVEPSDLAVSGDVEAELRRDDDVVADGSQGLANDLFAEERPVDLGGVEEGDTAFIRRAYQADGLLPVHRLVIHAGRLHAAEADGGDFQRAELAPLERRALRRNARAGGAGLRGLLRSRAGRVEGQQ